MTNDSKRRGSRKSADQKQTLRISPKLAEGLSPFRKEAIEKEIESGAVQEGRNYGASNLYKTSVVSPKTTDIDNIQRGAWLPGRSEEKKSHESSFAAVGAIAHSESFVKNASGAAFSSSSGGGGTTAGSSVERLAPEVYSPLFTMANLNLPRDRITVNAWIRNFFLLHPIVRNAITLHATYPISKINFKCHNKKVLQFFEDMAEEMYLMQALGDISSEYWKMGECVRGCNYLRIPNGLEKISNIKVGDYVLTHTGEYKRVKDRFINWKHKEYLSIRVQGSTETIEVSKNHPFYILKAGDLHRHKRSAHVKDGIVLLKNEEKMEYTWKKAENLRINDYCLIPINRDIIPNKEISKNLCRIIGLYLAEGSFGYNRPYNGTDEVKCTIITNKDNDLWNYYRDIFNKCNIRVALSGDSINGYLRSILSGRNRTAEFAKKIKNYAGQYSKNKCLSKEIMFLDPEKQMEIVNGFIDGDGWIHRGRVCMATISRELAFQIRDILARNYITCSINKHSKNRINPIYFIEVPLFFADRFNLSPTKQRLLDKEKECRPLKPNNLPRLKFSKDGHILAPIKNIEIFDLSENEPLFNFEIEDNNSYCVQGVATHNCFPYAELNEETGKWSKIVIQNPDYIHVKKTILSGEPIISLKPDAVLQRLVMSSNPADVQLRKQIPEKIIYHVRKGEDIPLDNFNVSHLKMLSSPYDVRGTSIIVSVFKDLMLYDKLRECYSDDTEYLTNRGFLKYENITKDDKLATFNSETKELEYQNYTERTQYHYEGDMFHFNGQKIDVLVTPNHRMWLSHYTSRTGYKPFDFIRADEVKMGAKYKARSVVKWNHGTEPKYVNVLGKNVPVEEYLNFLGHLISEGSVRYCEEKSSYCTAISQLNKSPNYDDMKNNFYKIGKYLDRHISVGETPSKNGIVNAWRFYGKDISYFFKNEVGSGASNKKVPRWVKELSPRLIKIILNALVAGDGSVLTGGFRGNTVSHSYSTVSSQLADDVQELALKCGYAPKLSEIINGQGIKFYYISWSLDTNNGKFPFIYGNSADLEKRGAGIQKVLYSGNVSCFSVPNSLLVVRRNGLISIQGNSKFAQADGLVNPITIVKVGGNTDGEYRATQEDLEFFRQMFEEAQYDKDFKLITHAGVSVERVGSSGQIIDIGPDMELIIKNIYTGLMVPPAVVDTESAVYASASIGLEVLRQRYFNFRHMMAQWLQNKIFAPISEINDFYDYEGGTKRLIVPEIEWNQMNLYDLQDYIANISGLVANKQVSLQTLYRSLGLSYQDERVKIRQEMINDEIRNRENENLRKMTIAELRSLDPEKEVMEPIDEKERAMAAGEMPPEAAGGMPGMPGGMPGEMALPGGLGELAPPPGGGAGPPGAGVPEIPGGVPPLGPGGPGGAGGGPGL